MKEQILNLRHLGYSYTKISNLLNIPKSTVRYHCNPHYKEQSRLRTQKHRQKHPFVKKIQDFTNKKQLKQTIKPKSLAQYYKLIYLKIRKFHKSKNKLTKEQLMFTVQDVIDKFGKNPKCYLTGTQIDINKPRTYHFDHIIPASKGGTNDIDNLGICTKEANLAKRDMTPDEFINLCKQVLLNNGYTIT